MLQMAMKGREAKDLDDDGEQEVSQCLDKDLCPFFQGAAW